MSDYFNLPSSTVVNRVVPKNAFDKYTNTLQKGLFTNCIQRITWTNKISKETTNLPFKEVSEIQLFTIELKLKEDISPVLEIIDKAIPYPIIFTVYFDNEIYISTSPKHPHPTNENCAVIDWTFRTEWLNKNSSKPILNLKNTLDEVFKDFCIQISGKLEFQKNSLQAIVLKEQQINKLSKEINKLRLQISKEKQFNKKVELNQLLNQKQKELKTMIEN